MVARELEGLIIDESDEAVKVTKRPGVVLKKAAPAGLFFLLCLGGGIATVLGLATSGEWQAMSMPQRAGSVAVAFAMLSMAVMFGRSLYLALDRGFRLRASASGVSLRRHHFSRLDIPREIIAAVHVRARTFQPPRQPRYCQIRLELELREIDDALDLFSVGLGNEILRDNPDNRARLTKPAVEIGDVLARALGVPRKWTDFR